MKNKRHYSTHLSKYEPTMRQPLLLALFFFTAVPIAQAQCDKNEYTRIFNEAVALQEKGAFIDAKNRYEAAKIYACNEMEKVFIDGKVDLLFEEVIRLRQSALAERIRADLAKSKSDSLFEIANNERAKAESVLNAIYFYNDKFGLATKKKADGSVLFGFVDKNLNPKIDFIYAEASQFVEGYAKVKRRHENSQMVFQDSSGNEFIMPYLADFLIDTFGREYLLANSIIDLPPSDDEITALDLSHKYLTRIPLKRIPYEELEVLFLNFNFLEAFPPQILHLSNLRDLQINFNQIKELPEDIDFLSSLADLGIGNNQLLALPVSIGQLSNLVHLGACCNKLKEVPSEIGDIPHLNTLYLYKNNLKNIPKEIGHLRELEHLDLSDNFLAKLPDEMGQLERLKLLEISRNSFSDFPRAVGEIEGLEHLGYSGNGLSVFPETIFKLKNLKELGLLENKLEIVPKGISSLKKLHSLGLSGNLLTSLPPEIKQLNQLQNLYLSNNKITGLPDEILQMKSLKLIDLSNNPISLDEVRTLSLAMPWCEILY